MLSVVEGSAAKPGGTVVERFPEPLVKVLSVRSGRKPGGGARVVGAAIAWETASEVWLVAVMVGTLVILNTAVEGGAKTVRVSEAEAAVMAVVVKDFVVEGGTERTELVAVINSVVEVGIEAKGGAERDVVGQAVVVKVVVQDIKEEGRAGAEKAAGAEIIPVGDGL